MRPPRTGSREWVLAHLREADRPLGVREVTEATGLSPTAVRFHLDNLVQLGVVRATTSRTAGEGGRPGRPAIGYSALPAEAVDPASAYRILAGLMARELAHVGGGPAATEAGRAWAARMLPTIATTTTPDPVDVVVELFARTGFDPERLADGTTLHLRRCPFRDLAAEQPEMVCGIHLGLVTGVLEHLAAPSTAELVPELTPVLDAPGPCVLHLRPRSARPEE